MKKRTLSLLLVLVLLVAAVVVAVLVLKPGNEPAEPEVSKPTYTDKLTTETGTITAYCPVCDADKTWIPYNKAYSEMPEQVPEGYTDNHFYLTENLAGSESYQSDGPIDTAGIGTACVHLNGFDISNTAGRAIYVRLATDTLNIMGTGNVSGCGTYGATLYNKGTLNLYSGTYTKAESVPTQMLCITNAGTYLNVYDDVVITDTTTANCIRGEGGGHLNFAGATINGIVSSTAAESIKVSGDVVIQRLNLKKGLKIEVGTMTAGASVVLNNCVNDDDLIFSNAPAEYAPYFKSGNAGEAVVPTKDGKLAYATGTLRWTDAELDMAICPRCNKDVVWYGLNNIASIYIPNNSDNTHFFLEEDIAKAAGFDGVFLSSTDAGGGQGEYCLHLNGKNVTNTSENGRIFFMNSTAEMQPDILNVMGSGVCTGGATGTGLIYVRTPKNTLNLYGGTYAIAEGSANNVLLDARGPVFIGDGVVIQKKDNATKNVVKGTTLTMNGGKIDGILEIMDNKTSTAAATTAGAIVMNAGTIEKLNVIKQDDEKLVGTATINGGAIGTMTMDALATVTVAGAPVVDALEIPANAKINLGELVPGAKITVKASGVFTNASDKVAAYKDYFVAATGSIQVDGNALKCG